MHIEKATIASSIFYVNQQYVKVTIRKPLKLFDHASNNSETALKKRFTF